MIRVRGSVIFFYLLRNVCFTEDIIIEWLERVK